MMSKVIRISDSIFSRLQQLGTPLVDTPASVIERVLDYYEKSHQFDTQNPSQPNAAGLKANALANAKHVLDTSGLYLAPANEENLKATIIGSKLLNFAETYLTHEQFSVLKNALSGKEKFHCWAMTKNSRSKFNAMNIGDFVLFTSKGTGLFSYYGRVICKLESAQLGKALWRVVANLPWDLIYFLDDITPINLPKERLVGALGYDQGYVVPGIIRVSQERVQKVLDMYGNISNLITKLSS